MSAVAGVSLLDGVLIGADCRMTFKHPGKTTYRDTVQKIIQIGPHTVIGFVGLVPTAAELLVGMLKARGTRQHSTEFQFWLPRYFKHEYRKLKTKERIDFMVASVDPGRPNIVQKSAIASAVINAAQSRQGSNNIISRSFLDILSVPTPAVSVQGSGEGHLYTMLSPEFTPRSYDPMQAVVIGSGENMRESILQVTDQIHFDHVLNDPDVTWLGRALQSYLSQSGEMTVGTMFPMMKITARNGVQCFGRQTINIKTETSYELTVEGTQNRWVQRNLSTGEQIDLLMPWEIDHTETEDQRFDDLRPKPMKKS
jgi:hypothetical protein